MGAIVNVTGLGNYQSVSLPRYVSLVTTDSLATITAAGYLNANMQVPVLPGDFVFANFGTGSLSSGIFSVSLSAGLLLMTPTANGVVGLPVVSGDIPVFSGTNGDIADSGVAFSNNTDTVAPLFHGAGTVGHFVTVNNANKTIQDSGAAPSAASQAFVVMSPGSLTTGNIPFLNDANGTLNTGRAPSAATAGYKVVMSPGSLTSGNLVKLADANGTIADQGVAMKSVAQAAVAGGAAAQTVTDAFCTSAANVICTWNDTTNAVSIQKVVAGNGSFVVTSSGDPGASHLNYVIFK
jgi:hypothetical protein